MPLFLMSGEVMMSRRVKDQSERNMFYEVGGGG
jgi:hypothetical protein